MRKQLLVYFCIILSILLLFPIKSTAAKRVQTVQDPIILVIDPGHGGENNGTTENGFLEKDMNFTTAKALVEELSQFEGIEIYLTRNEDVDLTLKDRAKVAESYHADFLISLHYNASESHLLYGSEVWISLLPEYHAQGYQLATCFLREFREMGLTLRGIKTKRHSNGKDYYGVIRESTGLGIPAIIVEHCHVDHHNDNSFCDSEEELIAFGKADAHAIAKYFGLKSSSLGIDYSAEAENLPEVTMGELVPRATQDASIPLQCSITLKEALYEKDQVTLEIRACDPDTNLIYYAYSLDGGKTFCEDLPWPEGDLLTGVFTGELEITLDIPDGTKPEICFRVTNPYDLQRVSNVLTFEKAFQKPEEKVEETFPEPSEPAAAESTVTRQNELLTQIISILQIAILAVAILFVLFFFLYLIRQGKNKRQK